jgi:hypothetical protein
MTDSCKISTHDAGIQQHTRLIQQIIAVFRRLNDGTNLVQMPPIAHQYQAAFRCSHL